jgi:very-short-patch-repair endonuclease
MYRDKHQRDFARALRNQPTDAETRLWRLLRAQQLRGIKFRRQAAIGPYTVDFVCFSQKLIIELDGPQHVDPPAADYDARRTEWLSSRGFQVLRFRNQELDENIQAVVDAIERALELASSNKSISPLPNPPRQGEGTNPGD